MSTDWIKMRVDLRTHPKVVRMASALKSDKLRVIGGLFSTWSIFDAHSCDGFLEGYSFQVLDDELGWKGFSKAMAGIGWLSDADADGLTAPQFDEHNGQSAKRRALDTQRKRLGRSAEEKKTVAGQMSAFDADENRTREEKRREEEKREREKRTQPVGVDPPTERALSSAEGFEPTPAGAVCRSMMQAGLPGVNPGDPRLLVLLEQGATTAEFVGLAAEAAGKAKGFAWVLAVLQARRSEAAAIRLAPSANNLPPDPMAWSETQSGVITRAANLGIDAWSGDPREWPHYRRRVLEADAETRTENAA